jgi:hypothetical protein
VAAPAAHGGARRAAGFLAAAAGPVSAVAAAVAVAKGALTAPAALLGLALLGAIAVVVRTPLEPARGGMPSLAQALHLVQGRRAVFPRDFTGAGACLSRIPRQRRVWQAMLLQVIDARRAHSRCGC